MSLETLLDGVTATGAGTSISTARKRSRHGLHGVVQISATNADSPVSIDATVKLQGSIDNSNWFDIATFSIDESSSPYASAASFAVPSYLRGNVAGHTSGTFTMKVDL